eukprot:CAMPEP_0174744520 /NCGR_PEP_ID=MMETSP1094-20130205/84564_2 /TAXON_ID=156173 /ORGANISM="Chrysochromulina brevifilum, Strain UTEX LB 985" /LENGTH=79 /DNA_ID=CAMNT_0015948921 /DNA_START=73 /DNA_END=312 /DNA_ORIENTATION=-
MIDVSSQLYQRGSFYLFLNEIVERPPRIQLQLRRVWRRPPGAPKVDGVSPELVWTLVHRHDCRPTRLAVEIAVERVAAH